MTYYRNDTTTLHFGTRPTDEAERDHAARYLVSRGYTAIVTNGAGGFCVETDAPYKTAISVKRRARTGGDLSPCPTLPQH